MTNGDNPKREFLTNLSFKLALNTASYPFEYAKVLIQIGHEPLAPYPTRTALFRKPVLGLPNVIDYVKYIKRVDGFGGCYRGLSSRLVGNSVHLITCTTVTDYANVYLSEYIPYIKTHDNDPSEKEKNKWRKLLRTTLSEIAGKSAGAIVSHPFQVISIRIMAQFVGGESYYNGIFSSIAQIYRTDGILGFFAGLVPRILAEIMLSMFINVCVFLAENYINDNEITKFSGLPIAVVGSAVTYPFHVVATCMAVNNSGLAAGNPPQMPIYSSWIDCWKHLSRTDQLSRGSSMFFRYYRGAHVSNTGYHNFVVKDR